MKTDRRDARLRAQGARVMALRIVRAWNDPDRASFLSELVILHRITNQRSRGGPVPNPPKRGIRPIHPGEILREEYLTPLRTSVRVLARHLGLPEPSVAALVAGKRPLDAEDAIRLGLAFGTSSCFWLNMQADYDLRRALRKLGPASPALRVRPLVKLART